MPAPTTNIRDAAELERLVDLYGVGNVISALAQVCSAKADHIRHDWQDVGLASDWRTAGLYLDKVARTGTVRRVTHEPSFGQMEVR